jgi:RimJ/RimL family protein N-acetyltransferase
MRVLEKAGFRREGVLRLTYVERDGTPVDGVIYGQTAEGLSY